MRLVTSLIIITSLLQITLGFRYPLPPKFYNYQRRRIERVEKDTNLPLENELKIAMIFQILRQAGKEFKAIPNRIIRRKEIEKELDLATLLERFTNDGEMLLKTIRMWNAM